MDEPVPYVDSYGNYYANWTPELYQKYGLPQDYYQPALHDSKKNFRRQGAYDMMTNMFGEEAGVCQMKIHLEIISCYNFQSNALTIYSNLGNEYVFR